MFHMKEWQWESGRRLMHFSIILLAANYFIEVESSSNIDLTKAEVVYSWNLLNYSWPSDEHEEAALRQGEYIPRNCPLTGIKVFKGMSFLFFPLCWNLVCDNPRALKSNL